MTQRFIFHGGAREKDAHGRTHQLGVSHNSAFAFAARNIAGSYPDFQRTGRLIKIHTAQTILQAIHKAHAGSIRSLDVVSHGTPYSLNFSVKEFEGSGFTTDILARLWLINLYSDAQHRFHFSHSAALFSAIDFSRFADDARVEIHGCNAARPDMSRDTVAEVLSRLLTRAGKRHAVVIGHADFSSPQVNPLGQTANREQDYRHGPRVIYNRGVKVGKIDSKGHISDAELQALVAQNHVVNPPPSKNPYVPSLPARPCFNDGRPC
jgi:hypothetical protein